MARMEKNEKPWCPASCRLGAQATKYRDQFHHEEGSAEGKPSMPRRARFQLWTVPLVMLVCTNLYLLSGKPSFFASHTACLTYGSTDKHASFKAVEAREGHDANGNVSSLPSRNASLPASTTTLRASRQKPAASNGTDTAPVRKANASIPHRMKRPTKRRSPKTCSPKLIDLTKNSDTISDEFYATLARQPARRPPKMNKNIAHLCNKFSDQERERIGWHYCLPITADRWSPSCSTATRLDLLSRNANGTSFCQASVLHMLLMDVYSELEAHGAHPALLFGTLLGAVRNGSIIPFTEDVDIGYRIDHDPKVLAKVRQALWKKGYHMFYEGVHRVCVAPTHPLAGALFGTKPVERVEPLKMPYVDLYLMAGMNGLWAIDKMRVKYLTEDHVVPLSTVSLNGGTFKTLADPVYFLEKEYGRGWRIPKPRTSH